MTTIRILKELHRDRIALPLAHLTAPILVWTFWVMTPDQTSFNAAVPRVLVFALLLQMFSAAIYVSSSVERGTYRLSRELGLSTRNFVGSVVSVHALTGALSLFFALVAAWFLDHPLGFEPRVLAVGYCLGVVAHASLGITIGFLAANAFRAFAISSFVMFLLMVFSGVVLPAPASDLFFVNPTFCVAEIFAAAFSERGFSLSNAAISLAIASVVLFAGSVATGSRR